MALTQPGPEYRFFTKTGEYNNRPALPHHPRRAKNLRTEAGPGKVCPGCGLTRSVMNKCECNS
jgi:hypothetical protein